MFLLFPIFFGRASISAATSANPDVQEVTPEYIFNPNRPVEFPDCDARYAATCGVQVTYSILNTVIGATCSTLAGPNYQSALDQMQSGQFLASIPGTYFGIFVLNSTDGTRLVDSLIPANVNTSLAETNSYGQSWPTPDKTVYGPVPQESLLRRFQNAATPQGRFVPHTYRWSVGGDVEEVLSNVRRCHVDTGHIIGVTIGRRLMPEGNYATQNSISYDAIANVRRIVGLTVTNLLAAQTRAEFEEVLYSITFSPSYKTQGGFYIFMYNWGNIDSPDWDIIGDSHGVNVAHPILLNIIGMNISAFRTMVGASQSLIDQGHALDVALAQGAANGGDWVDYLWGPVTAPYYKLAYTVGVKLLGKKYYFGSGFTMEPDPQVKGPNCATCSVGSNLPCAAANTMILTPAALARVLTDIPQQQAWSWISTSEYTADHGFYVFAFDYNGTCVADGGDNSNIGKTMEQIAQAASSSINWNDINTNFVSAAEQGGLWIPYMWTSPRIAYITKVFKYGRSFYLGTAFEDSPPPKQANCTASYAEPCAEDNAQRVVGAANSAILSANVLQGLTDVLQKIVNRTEPYADNANGFHVHVYNVDFTCPSMLQPHCSPSLSQAETTAIQPKTGSFKLAGWVETTDRFFYVLPVETRLFGTFLLVSPVVNNKAPRCDSSCPPQSQCVNGRCTCNWGWRPQYTPTGVCGDLAVPNMTCVDDSLASCTKAGFGIDANGMCMPCEPGYHKPAGLAIKMSPCLACPRGRYTASHQSDDCANCALGTFAETTGRMVCENCSVGSYAKTAGTTQCVPTSPGTFVSTIGQSDFSLCSIGTFASIDRATACDKCSDILALSTTADMAAKSASACVCPQNTYNQISGSSNASTCVSCSEGFLCDQLGMTEPHQATGYYLTPREGEPGYMAYLCIKEEACPAGPIGECTGGREGLVCSKCPDGEAMQDGNCEKCQDMNKFLIFSILVVFIFGLIVVYYLNNDKMTSDASNSSALTIVFGNILTILQLVASLDQMKFPWPSGSHGILQGTKVFMFDPGTLQVDCIAGGSAATKYASKVVLPYVVLLGLFSLYVVSQCVCVGKRPPWNRDMTINTAGAFLQTTFIAFAIIPAAAFQCYTHPNGETSLVTYPEVICGTGDQSSLIILAVILLGTLVLPFFGLTVYVNWMAPKVAESRRYYTVRYRFLLYRFRPTRWWWGSVLIVRQLVFAFSPVVSPDDPYAQILFVASTIFIYIACACGVWPWKSGAINYYENTTLLLLGLFVISAGAFVGTADNSDLYNALMVIMLFLIFAISGILVVFVVVSILRFGLRSVFGVMPSQAQTIRNNLATSWQAMAQMTSKLSHDEFAIILNAITVDEAREAIRCLGSFNICFKELRKPEFQYSKRPFEHVTSVSFKSSDPEYAEIVRRKSISTEEIPVDEPLCAALEKHANGNSDGHGGGNGNGDGTKKMKEEPTYKLSEAPVSFENAHLVAKEEHATVLMTPKRLRPDLLIGATTPRLAGTSVTPRSVVAGTPRTNVAAGTPRKLAALTPRSMNGELRTPPQTARYSPK